VPPPISKSRYLDGLQCHKLLWFRYNAKNQIPAYDASTQAIFDQGHLVGSYAKRLFPAGIEVSAKPWEYPLIEEKTKAALGKGKPVFEGGFMHGGAFARFDILNPVDGGAWDLIEVKSSTEVKEVNLNDMAIQYFIASGSGLKIRSCLLCHINNRYVRKGEIDPRGLFISTDVTAEVLERQTGVRENLKVMQDAIRLRDCPDIRIGPHCKDPYECILMDLCWKDLPEQSVFTLYRSRKSFEWYGSGILELKDIPVDAELTESQTIQMHALRSGEVHVDRPAIREFLATLVYPLYLLDFETYNTAIPFFDGVRPYQKVPFQYSLHYQESEGARPEHFSFLAEGTDDPRPAILSNLKNLLGNKGSIVCYNASFETGVMRELAEGFPEYQEWFEGIEGRIVDLIIPFRSFAYYNPAQRGSASLKVVLPALTGRSYEGMPIADGDAASREYLRVTFGETDLFDRATVREHLERYCGFDTEAMVLILEKLYNLASS
jgi:hypothetical protein